MFYAVHEKYVKWHKIQVSCITLIYLKRNTLFAVYRYNRSDIDDYENDLPHHMGDVRLWDGGEGWSGWRNNYWRDDYLTREEQKEVTGLSVI